MKPMSTHEKEDEEDVSFPTEEEMKEIRSETPPLTLKEAEAQAEAARQAHVYWREQMKDPEKLEALIREDEERLR